MNDKILTFEEYTMNDDFLSKHRIDEMAISLKDYRDKIDAYRIRLVENWCLCKYCQLYNKNHRDFNHWKIELRQNINALKLVNIKKGADKRKSLIKMLVNDYDYDDTNMIYRIIQGKFYTEHIDDEDIKIKVSSEFSDKIDDIINAIAIDSIITDKYIDKEFGI